MNTVKIIAVALGLTLISAMPAQAKDPCKAVLCLAGMLTGNDGGSECKSAVNDYFSIVKFKKGKFKKAQLKKLAALFYNNAPVRMKAGLTK